MGIGINWRGRRRGLGVYTYIPSNSERPINRDDLILTWCIDRKGIRGGCIAAWCLVAS